LQLYFGGYCQHQHMAGAQADGGFKAVSAKGLSHAALAMMQGHHDDDMATRYGWPRQMA
jgi:hypothetical protein